MNLENHTYLSSVVFPKHSSLSHTYQRCNFRNTDGRQGGICASQVISVARNQTAASYIHWIIMKSWALPINTCSKWEKLFSTNIHHYHIHSPLKILQGWFFFCIFVNRGIEFLLAHKLPLRHPPYHDQVWKLFCNSLYIWNWYGLGFLKHQFWLVLPLSERLGWSVKVFSKSLVNCAAQDMAG